MKIQAQTTLKQPLLLLYLLALSSLNGQRYLTPIFPNVDRDLGVQYGQAAALSGFTVDLEMDIHEPAGDTQAERPLMILAHGGSFVAGDRSLMSGICDYYAERGYVTATISYRLGVNAFNIANLNEELLKAAARATQDFNAAIRFFYRSARDEGNPYRIDTTRIIVGGNSAGSIAAIHSQLFIDASTADATLQQIVGNLGGIQGGNNGSVGYPDRAAGLLNFAGAIYDSNMINTAHIACISFHGDNDSVVPYAVGQASFSGLQVMEMHGSAIVHAKLTEFGAPATSMNTFPNVGHGLFDDQARADTMLNRTTRFFYDHVIPGSGMFAASPNTSRVLFYPNPVRTGRLNIETDRATAFVILDLLGKKHLEGKLSMGTHSIDVSRLPAGIYWLRTNRLTEQLIIH